MLLIVKSPCCNDDVEDHNGIGGQVESEHEPSYLILKSSKRV